MAADEASMAAAAAASALTQTDGSGAWLRALKIAGAGLLRTKGPEPSVVLGAVAFDGRRQLDKAGDGAALSTATGEG